MTAVIVQQPKVTAQIVVEETTTQVVVTPKTTLELTLAGTQGPAGIQGPTGPVGPPGPSSNPEGTDGQIQYNNGGSFGGASSLYYDDVNDRVGIGTSSPTEKFHLSGGVARIQNNSSNWLDINANAGTGNEVYLSNRFNSIVLEANSGAADPYIGFYVAGSRRMVINNNGYVGIGTSLPAYKLEVNSTDNVARIRSTIAGATALTLDNLNTGTKTNWFKLTTNNGTYTYGTLSNDAYAMNFSSQFNLQFSPGNELGSPLAGVIFGYNDYTVYPDQKLGLRAGGDAQIGAAILGHSTSQTADLQIWGHYVSGDGVFGGISYNTLAGITNTGGAYFSGKVNVTSGSTVPYTSGGITPLLELGFNNYGIHTDHNGDIVVIGNTTPRASLGLAGTRLSSIGVIQWSNVISAYQGNTYDVQLHRDAAGTLAQRAGTTAQAFNIYNTYTDASNYERAALKWDTNKFVINTEAAGTGTKRDLSFNLQNIGDVEGNRIYFDSAHWAYSQYGRIYFYNTGNGYEFLGAVGISGNGNYLRINTTHYTNAFSPIQLDVTWNNNSEHTLIKGNVVDTLSASTSKLLDLQVGGVSKFTIDKNGAFVSPYPYTSTVGILRGGNGNWVLDQYGLHTEGYVGWGNPSLVINGTTTDVRLYRDDAGVLAQRNSTNAQTFNIYNTYTDASNYERLSFNWTSNNFYIDSEASGTGTARDIWIRPNAQIGIMPSGGGAQLYLAPATSSGSIISSNTQLNLQSGSNSTVRFAPGNVMTSNTTPFKFEATYNDASTTFEGIVYDLTDTASTSTSKLLDLQVGGVSKFSVRKDGDVALEVGSRIGPIVSTGNASGIQFNGLDNGATVRFLTQFAHRSAATLNGLMVASDRSFSWGPQAYLFDTYAPDLLLSRDAAGTLAQRNSTNAQAFNIYNTYTDASNYERASIKWDSNELIIGTESLGTGAVRGINFAINGAVRAGINTSGHSFISVGRRLYFGGNNSGVYLYQYGNGLEIGGGNITGVLTQPIVNITGTWNTTGITTGLKLNVTDTASASNSLLMDLQVGGASKLTVAKNGSTALRSGASLSFYRGSDDTLTGSISAVSAYGSIDISGGYRFAITSGDTGTLYLGGTNKRVIFGGLGNVALGRESGAPDNTVSQFNGTAAQTFRVYNTFTDASNYERGFLKWDNNILYLGTEAAGTGSNRSLWLTPASGQVYVPSGSASAGIWAYANGTMLYADYGLYLNGYNGGLYLQTSQGGITRTRIEAAPGFLSTSSTDDYGIQLAQTLNVATANPGAEYRALKINVTETDITGWDNVYLFDAQVGGVSKAHITNTGLTRVFQLGGLDSSGNGSYYVNTNAIRHYQNIFAGATAGAWGTVNGADWAVRSTGAIAWSSTTAADGVVDVKLHRDGPGELALRKSTDPQQFHIYNTYTDASNYERVSLGWNSNFFEIAGEAAGTGSTRDFKFTGGGRVGIGTSPADSLHIANSLVSNGIRVDAPQTATKYLRLNDSTNNRDWYLTHTEATTNNNDFRITYYDGTWNTYLTINNNGDVTFTSGIYAGGSLGTAGQVLTSNGTTVSWQDSAGEFTALTDTPANYTGHAGKLVRVNSAATELEFTDQIDLDEIVFDATTAPANGTIVADTFPMYLTATGTSPNRELALKVKTQDDQEIIIASVLV